MLTAFLVCLLQDNGCEAHVHGRSAGWVRRAARERNRAAQRQYRERQRGRLEEGKQKVAELENSIQLLTREKVRSMGKGPAAQAMISHEGSQLKPALDPGCKRGDWA